ncbi:protein-glutamate methylesterase/protein-glutamine glutaminase [Pseudobacillus wudalianchiensis]|uniref:Protein-glutamate methylesterase/protein-glutamine glutaminase n=1 Tax=Pseudobacillus wudalianchiensis TaxID=1743143 RepID=A0A1B9AIZ9_9BACI|nr:chemotaxis response regulator protein-glutamate methylesterase [Bacillus wudalianchiensis]OCA83819.1 chemotaxis response regulator protein-glutamate methylesterase [Bacillus wudalianchiensis]
MREKKVIVVDDSAFMRKLITEFLSLHPELEVVATARNGKDAIGKIKEFKPDVVTMDVEMPEMDGLDALGYIMENMPTPIVMLSSLTGTGAETTFQAMEKGAVDFIKKPSGTISLDLHRIKDELIEKVLAASKANLRSVTSVVHPITQIPAVQNKKDRKPVSNRKRENEQSLVVIGTSTGGPRALQKVLTKLPENLDAPVLVVQHMPPGFTKSLAERLDSLSAIHVKEAENGEVLQKGVAYICPGNFHLKVKKMEAMLTVHLDQSPPINGHRPAVDVMFESVSKVTGLHKVAVIMTGMGADGANGLIKLKEAGNVQAIAESEESCVVFGMPRAAIATRLVDCTVPVEHIAEKILEYIG